MKIELWKVCLSFEKIDSIYFEREDLEAPLHSHRERPLGRTVDKRVFHRGLWVDSCERNALFGLKRRGVGCFFYKVQTPQPTNQNIEHCQQQERKARDKIKPKRSGIVKYIYLDRKRVCRER